jgi:hypothetical protein
MNFVEFVEKYQQDMTPEQMLSIAKAIGKCLPCKLSDAEELKEMVVFMAIEYLQYPDNLYPTSKIWHNING